MPIANRTFRLFVSSTFSDMRAERRILQEMVFPRLKSLCESKGAGFQAVDLRWGVNEEAQLDHKTMDICLGEIARCQKLSPKPNFIILMGDRYGWQPVPSRIPSGEMGPILSALGQADTAFIQDWYREDLNAVPPEYVLQPRGDAYRLFEEWKTIEDRIRTLLRDAANTLTFTEEQRIKYFASATHQEVIRGALNPPQDATKPEEHVFAYMRTIQDLPEDVSARDFIDLAEDERDAYAKTQLEGLRDDLRGTGDNKGKLPKEHIYEYGARWENGCVVDNLTAFGERVYADLERIIGQQLSEIPEVDQLTREKERHAEFRNRLTEFFTGQVDALQQISSYIEKGNTKPLALIGPSGSGKSSIMAQAIHSFNQWLGSKGGFSIFRFIGVTSASSNLNTLLGQLCKEIVQVYDVELKSLLKEGENEEKLTTYEGLVEIFARSINLADEEKPLLIFLDALDQLQTPRCDFLRFDLPEYARIIVSALPELQEKLSFADIFMLPLMNEDTGKEILDKWFLSEKRSITEAQREEIIGKFSKNGLPIYLNLAFEQARKWQSYDKPKMLPDDVEGILSGFFDILEKAHTEQLVSSATGYLLSGKYGGLTETEVLDILAFDQDYWQTFLKNCHPTHRAEVEKVGKLPVVVWSRLFLDLEPYLTERDADGITIITFYHRAFGEYARKRYPLRHPTLADYFEKKQPLYVNEEEKIPNIRKVVEQPYQQTLGEQWDALEKTLTDLSFIEAKCRAEMVYELLRDYDAALSGLPEGQEETRKRKEFEERARHYAQKMIAYAKAWNIARDRHKADPQNYPLPKPEDIPFPGIIPSVRPWTDEEIEADTRRIINKPSQYDRIKAFSQFTNAEAHNLARYAFHPGFCIQQAYNSADSGPVATAAWEGITNEHESILLLFTKASLPKYNPHPACIRTLQGHTGNVNAVGITSDGKIAVSAGRDKTLRVWDIETGTCVRTMEGHSADINAVCITPTGTHVISGSEDKTLRVWNAETGICIRILEADGYYANVIGVYISPDGMRAGSVSDDNIIRIWDVVSGLCTLKMVGRSSRGGLSITPDGRRCVSGVEDNVQIWDLDTSMLLKDPVEGYYITYPNQYVTTDVCVTPDGRHAISADQNTLLCLMEIDTGACIWTLNGHTDGVQAVNMTPDGRIAVSGSRDKTLRVWDLVNGVCLRTLEGHASYISSVCITPDGRRAISASWDSTLRVWDIETGSSSHACEGHTSDIYAICATSDGGRAISASWDSTLRVWDIGTGSCIRVLKGHTNEVYAVCVTPDDRWIISGSKDKTVRLWDIETGECIRVFEGHSADVNGVSTTPDGRHVVSGSDDRTIRIWDIETGFCIRTLGGHSGPIYRVSITPDGRYILSRSENECLPAWNLATGSYSPTLAGHSDEVPYVIVAPDGRHIISKVRGNTALFVWDIHTYECVRRLEGHRSLISAITITDDARRVVSGSGDNTLRVWDIETGACYAIGAFDLGWTGSICLTNGSAHAAGSARGKMFFFKIQNLTEGIPYVSPVRLWRLGWPGDQGNWDAGITVLCVHCGMRFAPDESIMDAIEYLNSSISTDQNSCLHLPPEAWDDPRLLSECPHCHKPLRFNPFIVDNREESEIYKPDTESSLSNDDSSFKIVSFSVSSDIPPFPGENTDFPPAMISMPDISTSFFAWAIKLLPNPTDFEAKALFEKAMDLEGGMIRYMLWRIFKHILPMRRYQKAINLYDNALDREPHCAKIHTAKGITLARIGRRSEALEHFLLANKYTPDNAWVECNLALCYQEMGNEKQAFHWHNRAQKHNPR